jgi:hypothetical protein
MRIESSSAISRPLPAPESSDKIEHNVAEFQHDTLELAAQVRKATGSASVAVAPFAGTRITGFRELDLDGLVMVDWSRPGTEAEVRKALADPSFWKAQRQVEGGESSQGILDYPATAQILAKLQIVLGVTNVTVTHFAQPGDAPNLAQGTVDSTTKPFVTRFDFVWQGKPRSIAFVSWAITGDSFIRGREPMPNQLLRELRPEGFAWAYVAADGVGFFSKDANNGLQSASRTMVRDLTPGGGVLIDDPHAPAHVAGNQSFSGIRFMRGRARLEPYGVRQIGALQPPENVYGYAGLDARDRVRAYQKPGVAPPSKQPTIDTSKLHRGGTVSYAVSPL